jgi:hypothetical protein
MQRTSYFQEIKTVKRDLVVESAPEVEGITGHEKRFG